MTEPKKGRMIFLPYYNSSRAPVTTAIHGLCDRMKFGYGTERATELDKGNFSLLTIYHLYLVNQSRVQ